MVGVVKGDNALVGWWVWIVMRAGIWVKFEKVNTVGCFLSLS